MGTWHAYAKLRQHTEYTLRSFELKTKELGDQLRYFANTTSPAFQTKELPGETAARGRRKVANRKTRALSGKRPANKRSANKQPTKEPQIQEDLAETVKTFNLLVPKVHALGDYPSTIRWLGTTDSYSTQRVSAR